MCFAAQASWAIDPGNTAPEFELGGQHGPVKLSDFHGKLVYLDFWASWCDPCKRSFPWMNQLQTRFGPQGLQVLGVNLDRKRADADAFLAVVPANFAIGFDPGAAVARAYGLKGMPSSALIGRDGKVLLMHEGFNDTDKAELEHQIAVGLQQLEK